jgi:two-component system LytT family sensor kinase
MVDHSRDERHAVITRWMAAHVRPATAVTVVGCTALGLLTGLQIYLARAAASEPTTVARAFTYGAAAWFPWAAVAPVILWLGRVVRFTPGQRLRATCVHLLAGLAMYVPLTWLLVWVGFRMFAPATETPPSHLAMLGQALSGTRMQIGALVYAGILGTGAAERLLRSLREREMQSARLEGLAARARLETLATRLQPHFLFNTLHAIGALIDEDPARARAMLAQLGDLLRDVIAEPDRTRVPLAEELELLQRYLDIELIRFGDRLRVDIDASPEARTAMVPRLLLQPLAENALRHGLAPRAAGGVIRVTADVAAGQLRIVVWNDGVPLPAQLRDGLGLGTTRERLSTTHPDATVILRTATPSGVEAVVTLPLSRAG